MLCPFAATALESEAVAVDYREGRFFANLNMTVAVAPAIAMAVLTDFEHMTAFMPGLTSSQVLERAGRTYHVRQRGRVDYGPFHMNFESERLIEVVDGARILSRSVTGASNQTRSEMLISSLPAGIRIDYHIEMLAGGWLPGVFGSSFLKHELAEQFSALEREMLRRQPPP